VSALATDTGFSTIPVLSLIGKTPIVVNDNSRGFFAQQLGVGWRVHRRWPGKLIEGVPSVLAPSMIENSL